MCPCSCSPSWLEMFMSVTMLVFVTMAVDVRGGAHVCDTATALNQNN